MTDRTQAGAELAAYIWGILAFTPPDRRDVIYPRARSLIVAIEAEATAAAEQRLRASVAKVRELPSPDPSFPSGYYTADMVSRIAVIAILEGIDE